MAELFLGVDGGGSKTVAAVCDRTGRVLGFGRSVGSNYQSVGVHAATHAIREAASGALEMAGGALENVVAAAFGIAGADRARERAIVESVVQNAVSVAPSFIENDTLLVLRAGTEEGYGVGLVAGTGMNCIGRNRKGDRVQIGGMGPISGDVGFASDLVTRSLALSWQSRDGRIGMSSLPDRIVERLGLTELEDAYELHETGELDDARGRKVLAALFECAAAQDGVAAGLLDEVGMSFARSVVAAADKLELTDRDRCVVLGGSILQAPAHEPLRAAVRRALGTLHAEMQVCALDLPPVIGALMCALDIDAKGEQSGSGAFRRALTESLPDAPEMWGAV